MKKTWLLNAAFILFAAPAFSQKLENTVKVNLSSLVLKNFSLQYERGITKHISAALGIRIQPKGSLPFQTTAKNTFPDAEFNFADISMGNTAITPEVRFYLGAGRNRGFYIAPYARYAKFNMSLPINFQGQNGNEEAIFDGHVTSFSGGVMFGMQYTIGKMVVLDIWAIGAHYGGSNGNATFTPSQPLTNQEQQSLQQVLNGVDIKPFDFSGTVSANGAVIQTKGPWVGIRALGINVGVRF